MNEKISIIRRLRKNGDCNIIGAMSAKSDIAHRFKALRKEARKSQREVAEDLGVSQSTYASYENGSLTVEVVIQLVDYFGVTFDEVFTGRQFEPSAEVISPEEQDLLTAYRESDPVGQRDILRAALRAQNEVRRH